MKKLLSLFLVVGLFLLFCIPAFAEELSNVVTIGSENSIYKDDSESKMLEIGFGFGSANALIIYGLVDNEKFSVFSLTGNLKVSEGSTIYGYYSWAYDTMLTTFDVGNELKLYSDITGDTFILLGYGNLSYNIIDFSGTTEQKINGMYLGLKSILFGLIGAESKFYINPRGSLGLLNLDNLDVSAYDFYLQFRVNDNLSLKGGYSAFFVFSDTSGLDISAMVDNSYISWSYRL